MKKTSPSAIHNMGFLFSLLLLLTFVLCSLFTVLIGSQVYQNIRSRNNRSFYSGTALGYITNKVRQSDTADCITVRTVDGTQILVLTSQYGETAYETWIYTRDGFLMELFSEYGSGLTAADGQAVMECAPITYALEDTGIRPLLSITLWDGSAQSAARLSLRSSPKGGVPHE